MTQSAFTCICIELPKENKTSRSFLVVCDIKVSLITILPASCKV